MKCKLYLLNWIKNQGSKVKALLQAKTATITENGETTITPDEGYDGLSSVVVTTNVSGGGSFNCKLDQQNLYKVTWSTGKRGIVDLITEVDGSNLDLTNFNNFFSLFREMPNLVTIKDMDKIKINSENPVSSYSYMFQNTVKIKNIDLSAFYTNNNTTDFSYMFSGCSLLETINFGTHFDFSSTALYSSALNSMFTNCGNLTDITLNNILALLPTATSYTGTKTLSNIGLTGSQRTKCTTLSNWSACESAGWTTGD